MSPSTMPYLSLITFAKGARQFVVQEALLGGKETIRWERLVQIYKCVHCTIHTNNLLQKDMLHSRNFYLTCGQGCTRTVFHTAWVSGFLRTVCTEDAYTWLTHLINQTLNTCAMAAWTSSICSVWQSHGVIHCITFKHFNASPCSKNHIPKPPLKAGLIHPTWIHQIVSTHKYHGSLASYPGHMVGTVAWVQG